MRTGFLHTVEAIEGMLHARIESLVREILPDGEKRGNEYAFRNPGRHDTKLGSASVNLTTGQWADFAVADCRSSRELPLLSLIATFACKGDFKEAVRWAKAWLGITDEKPDPVRAAEMEARAARAREERERAEAREREFKLRAAREIFLDPRCIKLTGSDPASLYLMGRGLDPLLLERGEFPRSLRFHPAITHPYQHGPHPALIAVQSLEGRVGGFAGIHRIYLAPERGAWRKAFGGVDAKLGLGYQNGATIRLAQGASKKKLAECKPGEIVHLTEGIEDGLALALAIPGARVVAAYSIAAIGNARFPLNVGGVVVVGDNDEHKLADANSPGCTPEKCLCAIGSLNNAVAKLAERHPVRLAHMPPVFKDINDALLGRMKSAEKVEGAA